MKFRNLLKSWGPVVLWCAIMFFGSTDLMSAEHTSRVITPLLRWFNPDISEEAIARAHFIVRKLAHLTEYAVLASLLLRALRDLAGKFPYRAAVVFLVALLFAATDEYHQSFFLSRTSSLGDIGIDCTGALLGILIYWAIHPAGRHPQTETG